MRNPPKEIQNFKMHGETVTVYEVDNVSDFLDRNRVMRPTIIVDGIPRPGENRLRAMLTIKNFTFVSKPISIDAVLAHARNYPGESLLDSVLSTLERSEQAAAKG